MKLHHIGVIIKHQRQLDAMTRLLGLREVGRGVVARYQAECIMLEGDDFRLEAIIPAAGTLAEYNGGRGGVHHIALELEADQELPADVPLLETEFVEGICGMKVNFIPPILAGMPVEIVRLDRG